MNNGKSWRRLLPLILILVLFASACGSSAAPAPAAAAPTAAPSPVTSSSPDPTQTPEPSGAVLLRDDGTGQNVKDSAMEKIVILTDRSLRVSGVSGPITYTVEGVQISRITVRTQETADLFGIEINQPATMIGIQISAENTTDDDVYFTPNMSTVITSDKEQADSLWLLSDDVGGAYYGNVIKTGQVYFICPRTSPETLTGFQWRIDPPSNSEHMRDGDPIKIQFSIS